MSAQFGYQPNYGPTQPMPQYGPPGAGQPQGVDLSAPSSGPNPYPVNFMPLAGDPATYRRVANRQVMNGPFSTGMYTPNASLGIEDGVGQQGSASVRKYGANWENPIVDNFSRFAFQGNPNDPLANRGTNLFTPQTPQQLQQMFSTLTPEQMQQYSSQMPEIQRAFQNAAQAYSNLYANPVYSQGQSRRSGNRLVDGLLARNDIAAATTMTQQQNADWLQAAQNTLNNRLNDAYLL